MNKIDQYFNSLDPFKRSILIPIYWGLAIVFLFVNYQGYDTFFPIIILHFILLTVFTGLFAKIQYFKKREIIIRSITLIIVFYIVIFQTINVSLFEFTEKHQYRMYISEFEKVFFLILVLFVAIVIKLILRLKKIGLKNQE